MKSFSLSLIIFLIVSGSIFSQNTPSLAPLNPDFVRFTAKFKNGECPLPGIDTFGTGGMPPPGMVSFDGYLKNNTLKSTTFNAVYDMRTNGLLTPIRGQTANGCWAFATIASVESRWLKLGLGSWDLSENNLKYCHGFDDSRSYYGNHWMSTAYFARRSGPLTEADDPNTGGSPGPGQCPTGKIPVAYITDARYLPHDNNIIKQSLLDEGAIYTMLYYNSAYFNTINYTYYYGGNLEVNHCVAIVGWDDNKVTAGGTGAWICKNSYGIGWGEAGFFYVSYNDHSVLDYNAYWPIRFDNVPNTQVYGYDYLGNYDSFGYDGPVGYVLVKFIASGKQLLSRFGTYAMAANATLEVDIFDNFDPVTGTPSGLLSHQTGLSCAMPGYYTFDLPAPVTIEQGNDFYIRVRYQTPDFNFPVPVEYAILGYANPVIESNICWISDNAAIGSWYLIGNSTTEFKWDPCVKVYTEAVITWTGTVSADWNTAGNWSTNTVPTASDNVNIPVVANDPIVNQDAGNPAACKNLTIESGAILTIAADKALTVNNNLYNNAGNTGNIVESGASLITKGVVNGLTTVKRNFDGGAWHLISSPVSNAVSGMFTGKYLQLHTQSSNTYADILATSVPLTAAKGFALYSAINFSAQYVGTLNSGINGSAGNVTRSGSGLNSGWNLVGNPYPSSINWEATSGWTKTNLNNAIYIENAGLWASYISGVGVNGGSQYIPPCQGFFVQVADGFSSGTLSMDNDVRVHKNAPFFKSSINNLVRLQVSGNGYTDETVVRFLPDATSEFDAAFDAIKFFGDVVEAAQLYSPGSMPLSINTLPETDVVPAGLRANKEGVYTIAATEVNDLPSISLEDTKTGIFTDLLKGSYSFNFMPQENEQRFVLHFNLPFTNQLENPVAIVYSNHKTIYVNLNDTLQGTVFIYSITGQLVAAAQLNPGSNKIDLVNSGNFIVKVITAKSTLVRKLLIQ